MTRTTKFSLARLRAAALVLAAAPVFAACESWLTEDAVVVQPPPSGGAMFASYGAIGTSISAGIQSGGINDSTQKEAFTYQLALAMGLQPGVNWFYPALRLPGCPAPFTNPLTGQRVAGASATGCALRDPASSRPAVHNTGIPFLRAQQATDVTVVPFPTDTLKLEQFITGGLAPVTAVRRAMPTFVTIEVGSNDVLHAATRGDTTLLTPAATFSAAMTAIADSVDAIDPRPSVAMANLVNVTSIPFLTRASTFWCGKTGLCGAPANPLFTTMTVDNSCAPAQAGGAGDSYLVPFTSTGFIVNIINPTPPRGPVGTADLNCATDVLTVTVAIAQPGIPAGVYPQASLNTLEYAAVNARVAANNAAIASLAAARSYALVDMNAAFAAIPATPACPGTSATPCTPLFPNFQTPTSGLFGPLFSLDGVHPTRAGHRLLAQAFADAINAEFGTSIVVP